MKKVLLDTNMFIYLLDHHVLNPKVEKLTRMLFDSEEYKIVIHPKTIVEAQKIKDPVLKEIFLSKLRIYKQIDKPPIPSEEFTKSLRVSSDNDEIDIELLYSVQKNCVEYFITNDNDLKKKASRIGLGERVLSIDEALEFFKPVKEEFVDIPAFIEEDYLRNMELDDPFFTSLRNDYRGFDNWFLRKKEEKAYVIRNDKRQITSFLMLKEEPEDDVDQSLLKQLPNQKRIKVSTFKVTNRGKRIGETFIKIMLRYASKRNVNLLYVTVFPKQAQLITLLSDYGFTFYTQKMTTNSEGISLMENVYVKYLDDYTSFPNIEYTNQGIFLVPIRPEYNKLLFPESEINFQLSLDDYRSEITSSNAIKKAYICNSNTKQIKNGDLLFFYSTRENMRMTAIGVVDEVYDRFDSIDDIFDIVRKRTAYSNEQLKNVARLDSLVILFKHYLSFEQEIRYRDLIEMGVISSGIQQIQKINQEKMSLIISRDDSVANHIKFN